MDDAEHKGLTKLIEVLLQIDKDIPYEDFFRSNGDELFNLFFKLTFYND